MHDSNSKIDTDTTPAAEPPTAPPVSAPVTFIGGATVDIDVTPAWLAPWVRPAAPQEFWEDASDIFRALSSYARDARLVVVGMRWDLNRDNQPLFFCTLWMAAPLDTTLYVVDQTNLRAAAEGLVHASPRRRAVMQGKMATAAAAFEVQLKAKEAEMAAAVEARDAQREVVRGAEAKVHEAIENVPQGPPG